MDILEQFGIEGKLLITQLINFMIFALVFWKFVLPRVTRMLDERKTSISDSLSAAEQAKAELEQAQAAREQELKKAREEAAAVIKEAKETAKTQGVVLLNAAKADADKLLERAKTQLEADAERTRAELRAELAGLAIETTRRVLEDVVAPADRKKIVTNAIKRIDKDLPKQGAKRGR